MGRSDTISDSGATFMTEKALWQRKSSLPICNQNMISPMCPVRVSKGVVDVDIAVFRERGSEAFHCLRVGNDLQKGHFSTERMCYCHESVS